MNVTTALSDFLLMNVWVFKKMNYNVTIYLVCFLVMFAILGISVSGSPLTMEQKWLKTLLKRVC